MARITAAPEWEWWLVFYFFAGGLAAGLYFVAALISGPAAIGCWRVRRTCYPSSLPRKGMPPT